MSEDFSTQLGAILKRARHEGLQRVLFHYFPKDAVDFLVGPDADIACTNSLYQNDSSEIITGVNIFAAWLENNVGYSKPHIKAIVEKIGGLLKMSKNLFPAAPYIFCLTAEEDKPYFWCKFAKGGGYAVGFDTAKLTNSINAICERNIKSGVKPHRIMYLMPTLYAKTNADEIIKYFWLLYEQKRSAFDAYAKGSPSADCNEVLSQILIGASVVKDEKFAVEREWRLVLVSTLADVPEAQQSLSDAIKAKSKAPKPRLKTNIFRECQKNLDDVIRCIWVSPQGDKGILHAKVQSQLGALLSPKLGNEIAKDGRPFVRDSNLAANNLCTTCPSRKDCPDAKRPTGGGNYSAGKWNRNTGAQTAAQHSSGSPRWTWIVLCIIAAIGVATWILCSKDKPAPAKVAKVANPGLIKAVEPAAAPKQEEETEQERNKRKGYKKNPWGTPIPKDLEYKPHWKYTPEDYARIDPGYKARHERFLAEQAKIPWKHACECEIAQVIFTKPGDPFLYTPLSRNFKEQFLKSLQTPIIVTKNDSPELAQQKREMIEVKKFLKDKLDDGEDIAKILDDERKHVAELNGFRDGLVQELRQLEKTATSEAEIDDFVKAANIMLKEKGIGEVKLPISATRLRLRREAREKNNP